jgi:SAM-dependent methyltransferase
MPVADWIELNRTLAFKEPGLREQVGPFPPPLLMQYTTGLTNEADFASHGADFWAALSAASPKPLSEYASILDFGCGCGRLARMFKGFAGRIAGCDIDYRHIDWCNSALKYMQAKVSSVHPPIPFADNEFEAVISISIFTHLTESSQDEFLQELARVCRPDGLLFLTIHGRRALERALAEPRIRALVNVEEDLFQAARKKFEDGQHAFVLQAPWLQTEKIISEPFEYGITFIPENHLRTHWTKWFDLLEIRSGAIHDFQDIIVLRPKK